MRNVSITVIDVVIKLPYPKECGIQSAIHINGAKKQENLGA